MTISEPTVYIDFLCPWAYRGSMWLAEVEKAGRIRPRFAFFSLSQNHQAHEGSPTPPVWERDPQAQGLPAFLAATAPRPRGRAARTSGVAPLPGRRPPPAQGPPGGGTLPAPPPGAPAIRTTCRWI